MERIRLEEAYEMDYNTEINQARREGERKAKEETAKKMIELGAEIDFISKATGLIIEEIGRLIDK